MRMTITYRPFIAVRLSADAFQLGGIVPFIVEGHRRVTVPARLVTAVVAEDGRSAELTFEIEGGLALPELFLAAVWPDPELRAWALRVLSDVWVTTEKCGP